MLTQKYYNKVYTQKAECLKAEIESATLDELWENSTYDDDMTDEKLMETDEYIAAENAKIQEMLDEYNDLLAEATEWCESIDAVLDGEAEDDYADENGEISDERRWDLMRERTQAGMDYDNAHAVVSILEAALYLREKQDSKQ